MTEKRDEFRSVRRCRTDWRTGHEAEAVVVWWVLVRLTVSHKPKNSGNQVDVYRSEFCDEFSRVRQCRTCRKKVELGYFSDNCDVSKRGALRGHCFTSSCVPLRPISNYTCIYWHYRSPHVSWYKHRIKTLWSIHCFAVEVAHASQVRSDMPWQTEVTQQGASFYNV